MADVPRGYVRARADLGGPRLAVRVIPGVVDGEVALCVDTARRKVLIGRSLVIPGRAPDHQVRCDVVLDAAHHGRVMQVQLRAGIEIAVAGGGVRNGGDRRQEADLRTEVVDALVLAVGIERPAQPAAAIVQADRADGLFGAAVVQRRLAVLVGAVEAHAPFLVLAEAAADVRLHAQLRLALEGAGQARQRFVAGALGDDVDRAADAAARADAVHQRARALEDLDTLHHQRGHPVRRRHAVEAVQTHVAARHGIAADLEILAEAAAGGQRAHRGLADDHVRKRAGLRVLQHLGGVVGGAERHVHHVGCAQHAQAAAARNLAAGIGCRQSAVAGGGHHGGRGQHRDAIAGIRGPRRGIDDIGAVRLLDGHQPRIGQQRVEAAAHRVVALQARAAAAGGQLRLERQHDAGLAAEAAERIFERAGGDVIAAACRRRLGVRDRGNGQRRRGNGGAEGDVPRRAGQQLAPESVSRLARRRRDVDPEGTHDLTFLKEGKLECSPP